MCGDLVVLIVVSVVQWEFQHGLHLVVDVCEGSACKDVEDVDAGIDIGRGVALEAFELHVYLAMVTCCACIQGDGEVVCEFMVEGGSQFSVE